MVIIYQLVFLIYLFIFFIKFLLFNDDYNHHHHHNDSSAGRAIMMIPLHILFCLSNQQTTKMQSHTYTHTNAYKVSLLFDLWPG